MEHLTVFGFVLHLVMETAAIVNFLLRPSATLSISQLYSHGIIWQYAPLLLATNIIVAVVLNRATHDALSGQIAAAVAMYHGGPFVRAVSGFVEGRLTTNSEALGFMPFLTSYARRAWGHRRCFYGSPGSIPNFGSMRTFSLFPRGTMVV